MTISKKLFLIAALGLSMPFFMQSAFNDPSFASNERTIIAGYMPILRTQTTIDAKSVVQWLDKKLRNESLNKYDAATIANILESSTTIETKITDILHIITLRKAAKAGQKVNKTIKKTLNPSVWERRKEKFAQVLGCIGLVTLAGLIIALDATVNPHPRCHACICNYPFYYNGNPCGYIHTCNPLHEYDLLRPTLHVHFRM